MEVWDMLSLVKVKSEIRSQLDYIASSEFTWY